MSYYFKEFDQLYSRVADTQLVRIMLLIKVPSDIISQSKVCIICCKHAVGDIIERDQLGGKQLRQSPKLKLEQKKLYYKTSVDMEKTNEY